MGWPRRNNIESNYSESAGINVNGNNIIMWTPCDYDCIRVIDEDGMHQKAYMNSSGSWGTGSDIRWKENIETIDGALSKVVKMRGVQYYRKMKADKDVDRQNRRLELGFIAQEVEEYFPELVETDSNGYKSVLYSNMTSVLVQATKELKLEKDAEIEALRKEKDAEINDLKTQLNDVMKRIEALENQ